MTAKPSGWELFSCAGRKALIIGGSSGIGLASAAALHRAGAKVFLSSRHSEKLFAAAESLADPAGVRWEAGDATSAADVARVVGSAVAFLGGLDTLVSRREHPTCSPYSP